MPTKFLPASLILALAANAVAQPAPEAPIAARLHGLVVVDEPAEIIGDGRPGVRGVDVALAGPFADAGLVAQLEPLIGRPLDTELLPSLRSAVGGYYADNRALLVRLVLPVQEVRDGVLQILLVRGRVGKVAIEGEKWFSEEQYADAFGLTTGDELDVAGANAALDRVNVNPFRSATVELSPGSELGVTDVTLRAQDRIPLSLTAGYSDTGTTSTGHDRLNAGVTWGDAFGRGDLLTYGYGTTPDWDVLRSHSLTYVGTLPWGHRLTLSGNHADLGSLLPFPFDQQGRSSGGSVRYEFALPAWGRLSHGLSIGADYKRNDSNLLFSNIPVFGSLTETVQGVLGYNGYVPDALGSTRIGVSVAFSPSGLATHDNSVDYGGQRVGADARYAHASLELARITRLPGGFAWHSSVMGQVATTNLLGGEQLALGGVSSLRGYEEGEVYADEGVLLRNELHLPAIRFGKERLAGRLRPLLFWDYGYGFIHDPLPGERARHSLSSVGVGARFSFTRHLSAGFDYGWQLIETGLNSENRSSRGHLNVNLTW